MGFCLKTSKNHGFANWFPLTFMAAVLSSRYKPCWLRDVLASKTHRFCSWPAWKRDNAAISQIHLGFPRPRFGDLVVWNMFIFHILRIIIPTDELIFFRRVGQPPTSLVIWGLNMKTTLFPIGSSVDFPLGPIFSCLNILLWWADGNFEDFKTTTWYRSFMCVIILAQNGDGSKFSQKWVVDQDMVSKITINLCGIQDLPRPQTHTQTNIINTKGRFPIRMSGLFLSVNMFFYPTSLRFDPS